MNNVSGTEALYKTFEELYRRVDLTRRARIKAADRLRSKSEFYEKLTHIYSLIILVLSIWFIDSSVQSITKLLLIMSLSLTFSTMFLGIKNYKERASNFENNYQQLNVLLNKLQRLETQRDCINHGKIKELHREYEKLIIGKENHTPIDYMTCNKVNEELYSKEIKKYNRNEKIKKILISIVPIFTIIISLSYTSNEFANQIMNLLNILFY